MLDKKQAEKSEINQLLEKGLKFTVGKREFIIKEPYLGTLDYLSESFIDLDYDEDALQENPLVESKQIAKKKAKKCARIVAIAVLNNRIKIVLFARLLTWYFIWKVKPSTMLQLAMIINNMCNFGDFINSIRLMSGARTTIPNRIEENKKG